MIHLPNVQIHSTVEAEAVEEGATVEAPPVVAHGASVAWPMSPPASDGEGGKGGEGSEGPGLRDGNLLADGETEVAQRFCRSAGRGAPAAAAGP